MDTPPSTEVMVDDASVMPPKNSSTTSSPKASSPTNDVGSGTTIGVGDFVEASFASFEKNYGFSAPTGTPVTSSKKTLEGDEKESRSHYFTIDFSLLYQTILYSFLPFLFLCARRSMFGVASLLRSFMIGHALRMFMTFFPGIPCSNSSTPMPLPIYIKEKVSSVLLSSTGASSIGGNSSSNHHNNNWLQYWQIVIVGKLGGDPNSCPPPSLALLALLTIFAFVVHPDGLTWVLLGNLRELLSNATRSLKICINMIKDGHIPTLAASGSLAAILALAGVLYRASTSPPKCTKSPRKDKHSGSHNHSRGKKKRGGRRGGGGGGSSHNHERRPGKHSSRIKHGSGNPSGTILRPLSESLENPDQNRQGDKSIETVVESCIPLVNPPEIPGRKLTDNCQDDGSASSTLSTSVSFTSNLPEISAPKNNLDEKKNSSNRDTTYEPATNATPNADTLHLKKDLKKNRKPKKQNNVNSVRNHRQKYSTSHSSSKQSHLRSVVSPNTVPTTSSRPSSYQTSVSKESRKYNQRKYSKVEKESYSAPHHNHNHHKKNKGYTTNSYFSSAPASYNDNMKVSNSVISNPKGSNTYQPAVQPNGYMFPNSFGGLGTMSNDNRNTTNQYDPASRYSYQGYGENIPSGQTYHISSHPMAYNYKYAQIPKNPGKIELAGLLAQVGLIGRSCADLLKDVPDVDNLSKFTAEQFEMYHVSKNTQFQIRTLVEARERKRRMGIAPSSYVQSSALQGVSLPSSNAIRPPPGLGFGEMSSSFSNHHQTATVESNDMYSNQFHQSRGPESMHRLVSHGMKNSLQGNMALQSSMYNGEDEEDSENIEADLLSQVGGQMAVSILDF